MKNNNILQNDIDIFVEERLQESYENIQRKSSYKKITNDYFEVFQKVKTELMHKEDLLEQFESASAKMYEVQLKEAYCTGINDMMEIFFHKEV